MFFRKRWFYIASVLLLLAGVAYAAFGKKSEPAVESFLVKRVDLTQIVSVTGRVTPAQGVDLAFDRGGRIAGVLANVGDVAAKGKVLVMLENNELSANLAQAKAALAVAQATLAQARHGARPEDIAVSEAQVKSAQASLADAKRSLADAIRQAYTAADDAFRNKTDAFFANPGSRMPTLVFPVADFQLKTDIESGRPTVLETLKVWGALAVGADANASDLLSRAEKSVVAVRSLKSHLDQVALAVNALLPSASLSQAIIDIYKANAAAARTALDGAVDGLAAAIAGENASESALAVVSRQFELKRAGSSPDDIAAKEAQVAQAAAGVANLEAQLGKTVLVAPFNGVVTRQDAKTGQIAVPNAPLLSLIGEGGFEIEANVPEADIAKISVGNVATTTLDAYGSGTFFPVIVEKIDPAETLVDNVPTYKITLRFLGPDERIKSGMTANIDILTQRRSGVLAVPARALSTQSTGGRFVSVPDANGASVSRRVETGIRGIDGLIEVTSGLSEGETVRIGK